MWGDRWGATDDEVARHYPCDDIVPAPTLRAWRAVTVETGPERLWPWVVQVQLAPYSYDWVDNLGHRSPRELRDVGDPAPGDPFTRVGGRPAGRVLAVEHRVHLTARIMGATMTYRLLPTTPGRTRLVLKIVASLPRPLAPALSVGDLIMARRQLLTFKRLAEGVTPAR